MNRGLTWGAIALVATACSVSHSVGDAPQSGDDGSTGSRPARGMSTSTATGPFTSDTSSATTTGGARREDDTTTGGFGSTGATTGGIEPTTAGTEGLPDTTGPTGG